MADEVEKAPAKEGGGINRTLIVAAIAVVVAAAAGLILYRFFVAPRLNEGGHAEAAGDHGGGGGEHGEGTGFPVSVEFPQKFVNIMRDGDEPASTLVFQVTLECKDQATADIVNAHKIRFDDMLIKLHDSRTRDELDDVLALKVSIQRQAKQKANELLDKLSPPESELEITDVFHNLLMVQDQG